MVARDVELSDVVVSGTIATDAERDHTVSVDVAGLESDTIYFYAFGAGGAQSPVGRTRTLPRRTDHIRFAMVSRAKFNAGYFNAYARIADRQDLGFLLHLGDYIYEASNKPPPTQTPGADIGRPFDPLHECVTLDDYRRRYAQYRRDPDVQRLHAAHPVIATIDDHEFADGAWRDGADNHKPEWGPWEERKARAFRAKWEWVPGRPPAPDDPSRVFRSVPLGGLAELFVLDTRTRRDRPVPPPAMYESQRSALGPEQRKWLFDGLKASNAIWHLLANPSVMARTWDENLPDDLRPHLVKVKLLEAGGRGPDFDQWDGYPSEREALLRFIRDEPISDVVVLSGDVHVSLALEMDVEGDEGEPVTVEFVTPSITSQNLDDKMGWAARTESVAIEDRIESALPHWKWSDLDSHGYVVVDVTPQRLRADWWFSPTVLQRAGEEDHGAAWMVERGRGRLAPALAGDSLGTRKAKSIGGCPARSFGARVGSYAAARAGSREPTSRMARALVRRGDPQPGAVRRAAALAVPRGARPGARAASRRADRVPPVAAVHRLLHVPRQPERPEPGEDVPTHRVRVVPAAPAPLDREPRRGRRGATRRRVGDGHRHLRPRRPSRCPALGRRPGRGADPTRRIPAPDRAEHHVRDAVRGADPRRDRPSAVETSAHCPGPRDRWCSVRPLGDGPRRRRRARVPRDRVRARRRQRRVAADPEGGCRCSGLRGRHRRVPRVRLDQVRRRHAQPRRRVPPVRAGGDDRRLPRPRPPGLRARALPGGAPRRSVGPQRVRPPQSVSRERRGPARHGPGRRAAKLRAAGVRAPVVRPRQARRNGLRQGVRAVAHDLPRRRRALEVAVPTRVPHVRAEPHDGGADVRRRTASRRRAPRRVPPRLPVERRVRARRGARHRVRGRVGGRGRRRPRSPLRSTRRLPAPGAVRTGGAVRRRLLPLLVAVSASRASHGSPERGLGPDRADGMDRAASSGRRRRRRYEGRTRFAVRRQLTSGSSASRSTRPL